MTLPSRAVRALLLLLVLSLLASACAGEDTADLADDQASEASSGDTAADASDDDTSDGDGATEDGVDDAAGDTAYSVSETGESGVTVEGDLGEKPTITLPEGDAPTELIIEDLVVGDGEEVPAGSTVTTHYVGVSFTNDGEQFDASWDRGEPISFPLDGVIPGWTEGIPGMRVGGRRLLVIPPDLAYGAQSPTPAIAENDTLVFVIDMVDVQAPPEPVTPTTDQMGVEVEGDLGEKPTITLPDGPPPTELVVVDLVEGDGEVAPPNSTVTTHYVGVSFTNDGEQFDASWDRGDPISFGLNQVISGWTEGIPGMKVGGRRLLIIPPDQAYGAAGRPPAIAENDTLVFVIDLTAVE